MTDPSVSYSDVLAAIGIAQVAAGGVLWLLGQRFATKTSISNLHRKIEEERDALRKEWEDADRRLTAAIAESDKKHELAALSAAQVANDMGEIKDMLRANLAQIGATLQQHGEKIAVLNDRRARSSKGAGGR